MITNRLVNLPDDLPAITRLLNYMCTDPLSVEQVGKKWQPELDELRMTSLAEHQDSETVGMVAVQRLAWMKPGSFRIVRQTFESSLDLTRFDEQPFLPYLERANAAGFRFFSLADCGTRTEQNQRKLYELNRITGLDNPSNQGVFPLFGDFQRYVFGGTGFRAAGQLLAAMGEDWVGLAAGAFYPISGYVCNAFTGVLRSQRGQGLAYALKLLLIRQARQWGARYLRTNNDSQNTAMLAVNRKLGYQPQLGYFNLQRDL